MKKTKIVFFGDSITDMNRERDNAVYDNVFSYGDGYPFFVAGELYKKNPLKYEILNRGISGDRTVDLYARIKKDVWNYEPDVLSILIGINDIWHGVDWGNGVEIDRFERSYREIIEDTKKRFKDIKIILIEPFVLEGEATKNTEEMPDRYSKFLEVYDYAKVVKKLADEYNLFYLPLQDKLTEVANKYGVEPYLYDGVHPMIAGAKLIADEWTELFFNSVEKDG